MHHETLTYQADGLTMRSQLFFEPGTDSGPRAGVLVFPEAFGLGRARDLAGGAVGWDGLCGAGVRSSWRKPGDR